MAVRDAALALVLAASLSGCLLDRSPIDVGDVDASNADGGQADSGPRDAGRIDAGPPLDAGGPIDAGPADDGGEGDACVPSLELCNGRDDDCDPSTADGADETTVGAPCDSADDDLCDDDVIGCVDGGLLCVDDGSDDEEVELCNGADDDCNAATPDGSDEPSLGLPCDSPSDDDLCLDDMILCVAGALSCIDDLSDLEEQELCNGVDDDCDGSLDDDGVDEPMAGVACDGPDADLCAGGVLACVAGVPACTDSAGDAVETCNAMDDDCDGAIDETVDCGCDRVASSGRVYLFCADSGDRRDWRDARDFCRDRGYELVSIETLEEQRFVGEQARARRADRGYWIGANDRSSEGNFEWVDDPPRALTYTYWNGGEPNDFVGEDCVELIPQDQPTSGLPGGWNDRDCNVSLRFVCEAGP